MKQINGLATVLGAPGFVALPSGTEIGGFRIDTVTSATLLDITYTAMRDDDDATYIVVEHFPRPIAFRDRASEVVVPLDPYALRRTRAAFFGEAKALLESGVANYADAIAVLEANGTAYAVFADAEAISLRQWVGDRDHKPAQAEIDAWLHPLLDALEAMHASGVVHGNLSPDTIHIGSDGTPALTGFLLARHVIAEQLRVSPTADALGLAKQAKRLSGPAADIYALGTVLRYVIAGAATKRQLHERYRPELLTVIEAALRADEAGGPKTIATLREILENRQPPSGGARYASNAKVERRGASRAVSPEAITGSMAPAPVGIPNRWRAVRSYVVLASAIITVCGAFAVLTLQVSEHVRSIEQSKPARSAVRLPHLPTSIPSASDQSHNAAVSSGPTETARESASDRAKPETATSVDVDADRLARAAKARRAAERDMEEHDLGVEVDAILNTLGKQRHSDSAATEQAAQQQSDVGRVSPDLTGMPATTKATIEPEAEHPSAGRDRNSSSEPSTPKSAERSGTSSLHTAADTAAVNAQPSPGQTISLPVAAPAETATASAASRDVDPR